MAKGVTENVTLFLIVVAVALGIASVILNKKSKDTTNTVYITDAPENPTTTIKLTTTTSIDPPTTTTSTNPPSSTAWTAPQQQCYQVGNTSGFKQAAEFLLNGLDTDYDPCEDFYMFTCGNFLKTTVLTDGESRNGTYDISQANINRQIAESAKNLPANASITEKIFKYAYESCYASFFGSSESVSENILNELILPYGGFPALDSNWDPINETMLWKMIGVYESSLAIPTLLQSLVSVDYEDNNENALYLYQGPLPLPRDFYVKPPFLKDIDDYLDGTIEMIQFFASAAGLTASNIYIAENLLSSVDPKALDNMLIQYNTSTIVNFVMMRLIQGTSGVIGGDTRSIMKQIKNKVYKNKVYDLSEDAIQDCIETLMIFMPYGMGYTYIKYIPEEERNAVQADVKVMTAYIIDAFVNMTETLTWMTDYSEEQLKIKKDNLIKNVGWPFWFYDFSPENETNSVDPYHKLYFNITTVNQSDYFHIYLKLTQAYQLTENFQLLEKQPERRNFLQSPAMVKSWYIPEQNSITFPYAAFNPPYYRLDFPQAYNYAGQGGTAGHELTHGYDDEGVQFGPTGQLSDCEWNKCGWMDKNSTLGFIDMAQCVVSQYSSQCCPVKSGSVHCANGATTQGENIADLGGQQSAYKAYRKYVEEKLNGVEEPRLPGMEQFTPNQIFWIAYGYLWCMSQSTDSLVNQLLTNPHAPGSCRVNQVMQDIPEFGVDFNCKKGSTSLYPTDQTRCKVWTGI